MVSGLLIHTLHVSDSLFFRICRSCQCVKRASSCAASMNDSDWGDIWDLPIQAKLLFLDILVSSSSLKYTPCCGFSRQESYLCFWIAVLAFPAMICACLMTDLSLELSGGSIVRPSENFSALRHMENRPVLSSS